MQRKDQAASISCTYFLLSQLENQRCSPTASDSLGIASVKKLVAEQLRTRTEFMRDDQHDQHTPVFVIAAYLSPVLLPYLTSAEIELAEKSLKIRIALDEADSDRCAHNLDLYSFVAISTYRLTDIDDVPSTDGAADRGEEDEDGLAAFLMRRAPKKPKRTSTQSLQTKEQLVGDRLRILSFHKCTAGAVQG